MNQIEIVATGSYLPKDKVSSEELAKKFSVTSQDIVNRTGIQNRNRVRNENIKEIAIKAVENLLKKVSFAKEKIDLIVVTSTTTEYLMPGISFFIQKELEIETCMCMDLLAGCSGYINALDIARNYIALGKVEYALVVGCEVLSKYTDQEDFSTEILLADGAGATLIRRCEENKIYDSLIESDGKRGELLTCYRNEKIQMNGKKIYQYAVTDTIQNVKSLIEKNNIKLEEIKYMIPHQSNLRIMEKIAQRLEIPMSKMYTNIQEIGNTFCASIPIALNEMLEKKILCKKDKILLLGYGGGLNLGSILLEV